MASFLPKSFLWELDETQLGSHLFQRVASFLQVYDYEQERFDRYQFSSLSESGFIPTQDLLNTIETHIARFSSLSESGFIPTLNKLNRFYKKG